MVYLVYRGSANLIEYKTDLAMLKEFGTIGRYIGFFQSCLLETADPLDPWIVEGFNLMEWEPIIKEATSRNVRYV